MGRADRLAPLRVAGRAAGSSGEGPPLVHPLRSTVAIQVADLFMYVRDKITGAGIECTGEFSGKRFRQTDVSVPILLGP